MQTSNHVDDIPSGTFIRASQYAESKGLGIIAECEFLGKHQVALMPAKHMVSRFVFEKTYSFVITKRRMVDKRPRIFLPSFCPSNYHMEKIEGVVSAICNQCEEEEEAALYFVCSCPAFSDSLKPANAVGERPMNIGYLRG